MSYNLDPIVEEKISERRDRHNLEHELRKYTPETQKRWVANPAVEGILQSYINSLIGNMSASNNRNMSANSNKTSSASTKEATKEKEKKKEEPAESDEETGLFDLFD